MHGACRFSYTIVKGDSETFGLVSYRGADEVYVFLANILGDERRIRADIYMYSRQKAALNDTQTGKHAKRDQCHICIKSFVKDHFLDSISVNEHETGNYCGQSHRKCYYVAIPEMKFIGPLRERKVRDKMDQWTAINQETC